VLTVAVEADVHHGRRCPPPVWGTAEAARSVGRGGGEGERGGGDGALIGNALNPNRALHFWAEHSWGFKCFSGLSLRALGYPYGLA
jgi:hypothetical protein